MSTDTPCRHLSTESLVAASLEGRPRPTCSRCDGAAAEPVSAADALRSMATAIRGGPKPKATTDPVPALNSPELENRVRRAFGLAEITTD